MEQVTLSGKDLKLVLANAFVEMSLLRLILQSVDLCFHLFQVRAQWVVPYSVTPSCTELLAVLCCGLWNVAL